MSEALLDTERAFSAHTLIWFFSETQGLSCVAFGDVLIGGSNIYFHSEVMF